MQAASDIFLGSFRGTEGRDFYRRQLKDMKGSARVEDMSSDELVLYAGLCGWALARGHARSGDRVQVAAYLGKSDCFDRARSPTLQESTPTRQKATMPPSSQPQSPEGSRPRRASEKGRWRRPCPTPWARTPASAGAPRCAASLTGYTGARPAARRSFPSPPQPGKSRQP